MARVVRKTTTTKRLEMKTMIIDGVEYADRDEAAGEPAEDYEVLIKAELAASSGAGWNWHSSTIPKSSPQY
jgi:hypothetical protein